MPDKYSQRNTVFADSYSFGFTWAQWTTQWQTETRTWNELGSAPYADKHSSRATSYSDKYSFPTP